MVAKYSTSERQRDIINGRIPAGHDEDYAFEGHLLYLEMDGKSPEWNAFAKDVVLFLEGNMPHWWIKGSDLLPDTGARREFGTGAVRDASKGKGHFHSIPPIALRKLAKRFEDGAAKYEKNNYLKGMNLTAFVDSINRHFLAIQEGASDEDHYGALLWNVAVMLWTDEEIKAGRLPKELDDLPYRPH